MIIKKENFHNYISQYEEDELFYRKLYFQEHESPDTFDTFLKSLDRNYISAHKLYVPALSENGWSSFLRENSIFSNIPSDIKVAKHFRYSPVYNHEHEYFEILCIYQGKCTTEIQSITHNLSKGDICIIPPKTKHSVSIFDDSIAINIMIKSSTFQATFFPTLTWGNALSNFFSHVLYKKSEGNYLIFQTGEDEYIRSLLEDICIECWGEEKYSESILHNLLMFFWGQLLRRHEGNMISFLTSEHESIHISDILDYINVNYKNITLQEAAEHFNFSTSYFSTLIKESTGKTFLEIIKNIKLGQACRILKNTNISISSICEIIGYENPEHFMRIFKKEYNITPGTYRKKYKDN